MVNGSILISEQILSVSNSSKLKVLSVLIENCYMISISRENNVSISTVQRVLGSCLHRFIDGYEYILAHLAFDEFKRVDRQLRFICLDVNNYRSFRFLKPVTRLCLSIANVSRLKLGLTLKLSQWILIFTINISSDLVFLILRLLSTVFT